MSNAVDRVIGARIRARRLEKGMNQAQLGEPAGLSLEQVQSYENAEESVSALDFFRIAAALGTKPPDLFPEPKK